MSDEACSNKQAGNKQANQQRTPSCEPTGHPSDTGDHMCAQHICGVNNVHAALSGCVCAALSWLKIDFFLV